MTDALGLPDELARALKFAGPSALRDVARNRDDVVLPILDQCLDRLVLRRDRGVPEVEIGTVKEGRDGHSFAMMASVN
jgi:hypothetical protein